MVCVLLASRLKGSKRGGRLNLRLFAHKEDETKKNGQQVAGLRCGSGLPVPARRGLAVFALGFLATMPAFAEVKAYHCIDEVAGGIAFRGQEWLATDFPRGWFELEADLLKASPRVAFKGSQWPLSVAMNCVRNDMFPPQRFISCDNQSMGLSLTLELTSMRYSFIEATVLSYPAGGSDFDKSVIYAGTCESL